MDINPPQPPIIKVYRPSKSSRGKSRRAPAIKPTNKAMPAQKNVVKDDDDDEELSDLDSVPEGRINDNVDVAGEEDAEGEDEDLDGEGEEIEVADEDGESEADEELNSDETPGGGSRADTPDLSRMTARQRAKHGGASQEYMKLSDGTSKGMASPEPASDKLFAEVQVKKHFTAEELSMRRAEMARRRRNLSEKRNEEVKVSLQFSQLAFFFCPC
jgi:Ino eighty subunit 2